MAIPPAKKTTCPECEGQDIARGVRMSLTNEPGHTGLTYKKTWIFTGTEPLLADLCRKCGTVVRLYVKNPSQPWVQ